MSDTTLRRHVEEVRRRNVPPGKEFKVCWRHNRAIVAVSGLNLGSTTIATLFLAWIPDQRRHQEEVLPEADGWEGE